MCGKSKRFLGTSRIHPDLSAAQTRQPTHEDGSRGLFVRVGIHRRCAPSVQSWPLRFQNNRSPVRFLLPQLETARQARAPARSCGPCRRDLEKLCYNRHMHYRCTFKLMCFFVCTLRFPASRADRGLADLSCRAKGCPVRWRLNLSMPVAI